MKKLFSLLQSLFQKVSFVSLWVAVMVTAPRIVSADGWGGATGFLGGTTETADVSASRIAKYGMDALLAVFFLGGAILVGMGVFAFANKDQNPQHAQGAWKKVAAGGALLAFTVLLGILKNTVYT